MEVVWLWSTSYTFMSTAFYAKPSPEGAAERSEFESKMLAGGKHTTTNQVARRQA